MKGKKTLSGGHVGTRAHPARALSPGVSVAGALAALGPAGRRYLSPIAGVLAAGPRPPQHAGARSRPAPLHHEAGRGPGRRAPHGAGGRRPGRAQPQPPEQLPEPRGKRERKPRLRGRGKSKAAARSRPPRAPEAPAGTRPPTGTVSGGPAPPLKTPPRSGPRPFMPRPRHPGHALPRPATPACSQSFIPYFYAPW